MNVRKIEQSDRALTNADRLDHELDGAEKDCMQQVPATSQSPGDHGPPSVQHP